MLTESDLQELGLPFGPRKRILNLLRGEKSTERSGILHQSDTSTSERRHLTVLFCDMVGFTKLSYKLDPEAMQIVLRSYEESCETCVNRYEGYVFRVLGDGVVAFFGFPLAHEAESERAVRAGLDIVDSFTHLHLPGAGRLQVRIGITSGMAVDRLRRTERGRRDHQSCRAPADHCQARLRRHQRERAPDGGRRL